MSRLTAQEYVDHIAVESTRFRDVLLGCDPDARVPACPDWSAADLLWHLTEVQWLWTRAVVDRPAPVEQDEKPERPSSYDEMLAAFDQWSTALTQALDGVPATDPAWTWSQDQTIGFIVRRQAHEALIHRLDAEQAAGVPSELPAELAADGVHEALSVMYGACPPWGTWTPLPHHGRVDCTDTGDEIWVQLGVFSGTDPQTGEQVEEQDLHVVDEPDDAEPDFVVDGPAGALDAWLWHRGDDSALSVAGDRDVHARFARILEQPID